MASIRMRTRGNGTRYWSVLWRDTDGTQRSESWDQPDLAQRFRLYLEAETGDDRKAMAHMLVAQTRDTPIPLLDAWMDSYVSHLTGITEGTRSEYQRLYARTWRDHLGHLPLDVLTHERIAKAVNALAGRLSPKSVANAHVLLSTALSAAVRDELLTKNPAKGMRLPRGDHETKEMLFLSQEEFTRLHKAVATRYQALVLTLAGTGMRWGEATALPRSAIDLDAATVRVHRAWKRVPGGWEIGPPKTTRSKRTVHLPQGVVEALKPLLDGPRDELIFTTTNNRPVHGPNFRDRVWIPATTAAGISPRPRVHDLRHSHVSWLIAAGVPLPVIQRRLGHESITTTIDTYGHLLPDLQRQAADAADAVFTPRAIGL